jgi:hypothetical protein
VDQPSNNPNSDDLDTLEETTTVVESSATPQPMNSNEGGAPASNDNASPPNSPSPKKRFGFFNGRFNIYLLVFLLIVILVMVGAVVTYFHSKQITRTSTISSQTLTQKDLDSLANSDVTVGDPKQVLNVQSNAVFAGKVLIQDSLEIAGTLQVGGGLALTQLSVSGNSTFDDLQVSQDLSVTGNTALSGQLTVQKGLSVNGSGTFSGPISASQITTGVLQLSGDLAITRHISAGGSTPTRTNGAALGSGGTVGLTGSDTAGTISINTGGNPPPGCFVNVIFSEHFNATPHIVITPVGSAAGGLAYYITRTTTGFSVCTNTAAPASQSFAFDYVAFD